MLERLFANVQTILLTHCEYTPRIKEREKLYFEKYGANIPAHMHPKIRDKQACFESSRLAVSLAEKYGTQCMFYILVQPKNYVCLKICP